MQNIIKLSAAVHELSFDRETKLNDDAENNTAVASAGSDNNAQKYAKARVFWQFSQLAKASGLSIDHQDQLYKVADQQRKRLMTETKVLLPRPRPRIIFGLEAKMVSTPRASIRMR